MEKKRVLKSVFVAFDDAGAPGDVQVQFVERTIIPGVPVGVIPDVYLPLARFNLADATAEERASLEAALGAVASGYAADVTRLQDELDDATGRATQAEAALVDLQGAYEVVTAERGALLETLRHSTSSEETEGNAPSEDLK